VGTSHKTLERLALRVIAFSQLAVKGLSTLSVATSITTSHSAERKCQAEILLIGQMSD
jgi:hypothetical protein